ncbi:MAG TPA: heparinase II/III family protein, partial [Flavilitoribacter sp.]|nr:heparinase II/III family protein [Flavilitoribacter sp.]
MRPTLPSFLVLIFLFELSGLNAQQAMSGSPVYRLQNPISVDFLKKHLRKKSPRLFLTPDIEKALKEKIQSDPVVGNVYRTMQLNAKTIQQQPLLERVLEGRRLLGVSREMLFRMNILNMLYRVDKDPAILDRINREVLAVCHFLDWNPSHYLDVAEMALAVAIAVDWSGRDLPKTTVELAKKSLIEKAILPSFDTTQTWSWWVNGDNNWNQVCHTGMVAAALVTADQDMDLATKTISRALEGMPHALAQYGPDGVYPEGATYWDYGTSFTVMTASMFESAFGTDFGLSQYPALMESALFSVMSVAPSGWYYNFADCGDKRDRKGDLTLAWFAVKTGNLNYFEKDRFLIPPDQLGRLQRIAGPGLIWLSQFGGTEETPLPNAWKGDGANPVVIFTGDNGYYFGGKGGRGSTNHGNMDAGSFIFELDGVRWVVDPGNQNYNDLEKTGFDLWGRCQECQRWTLLTKNNYGHSTLTVNDALHHVDGFAPITGFKPGDHPEATIDLTAVFGDDLKSIERRFVKDSGSSLLIEDEIQINENTRSVTWQLMTTADVEIVKGGAILKQDGKLLRLENLSHPDMTVSVISLDPAPLKLDRQIKGLKRIELRFPAYLFE